MCVTYEDDDIHSYNYCVAIVEYTWSSSRQYMVVLGVGPCKWVVNDESMCAANHHEREKHPRVKRNVLPASNRNERNPAGCAISARSFNAKVVHATTLLLVIICGGVGGWVVCGWFVGGGCVVRWASYFSAKVGHTSFLVLRRNKSIVYIYSALVVKTIALVAFGECVVGMREICTLNLNSLRVKTTVCVRQKKSRRR